MEILRILAPESGGTAQSNSPAAFFVTQATASAADRRALLVGEEAYVAAGGRIERDLFADEAGERWLDLPLLETLAGEKMEALAAEKAAELGLAWVRPTLDPWAPHALTAGLQRFVPERAPLTEEEIARIEEAEREMDALVAILEDGETPEADRGKASEKWDALDRALAALRDRPPILDEALRLALGGVLLLDERGVPRLDPVFYVEAPQDADVAAGVDGHGAEADIEGAVLPSQDQETRPKPLARALVDELAIQRRDVLAVHVAAHPALALDLATFWMVEREAVCSSERTGSSLMAPVPSDPVFGFRTPDARATAARTRAGEELERSWTSGRTRAERFDAFRALPTDARVAWLGHAVARTLEASANAPGERRCAFHDHLGQLLGIDVASWWRPTGANYFDRVPKSVILAALEEVGGPAFAARYASLKKAELSQSAERIFAGELIAEAEVKARALAWVPEAMRFAAQEPAVANADEPPPWDDEPAAGGGQSGETAEESEALDGDVPSDNIEEAA